MHEAYSAMTKHKYMPILYIDLACMMIIPLAGIDLFGDSDGTVPIQPAGISIPWCFE